MSAAGSGWRRDSDARHSSEDGNSRAGRALFRSGAQDPAASSNDPGNRRARGRGLTAGLIGMGEEEVTWEARHFGVRQRLTSRITAYDRSHRFRDSQVRGAFRPFDHDHVFSESDGVTVMTDVFVYQSPLGWLGRCADRLFLEAYVRR